MKTTQQMYTLYVHQTGGGESTYTIDHYGTLKSLYKAVCKEQWFSSVCHFGAPTYIQVRDRFFRCVLLSTGRASNTPQPYVTVRMNHPEKATEHCWSVFPIMVKGYSELCVRSNGRTV